MTNDIKINSNGELSLDHTLDIAKSSAEDFYAEQIMIRLRTEYDSALWMPGVGSYLYTLIGSPNNRDTGKQAEDYALDAIIRDGFLTPEDVSVVAVPITENELALYIYLFEYDDELFVELTYVIDLNSGSIERTQSV